ncbi:MAG: heat shock protein Hsp20 [Frankiales bacterium]|nr:heat shock protein Hsp20 [Frankiales bacterium]
MSHDRNDKSAEPAPTTATWPPERIDRAVRDMFRSMWPVGLGDRLPQDWGSPLRLEEFVESGTAVIRAELAGIDPDKDVTIEVVNGVLEISGHREERSEDVRPHGYRSEFRYGAFRRAVQLPPGATADDVTATYKDGILEVRVPIPEAGTAASKVTIQHA